MFGVMKYLRKIIIKTVHPSSGRAVLAGVSQGVPDIPLAWHHLPVPPGDRQRFPGWMRHVVPPGSSGSPPASLPSCTRWETAGERRQGDAKNHLNWFLPKGAAANRLNQTPN